MATSTKRPSTITQTTGSYASGKYYRSWSYLNNLKQEHAWASCGTGTSNSTLIAGKNGTYPRPAPLKLTNFKFNIPATAKITSITVYYRHIKNKIKGAYGTFAAPTIDLLNVSASAKKGVAVPAESCSLKSLSWSISPSVSKVNSSSFGVSINYPANSSTNPSQIKLDDVQIRVTYTNAITNTSSSTSSQSFPVDGYIVGPDGSMTYVSNIEQWILQQNNNPISNVGGSVGGSVSTTSSNVSKSRVYLGETVDITMSISASSNITASTMMYIGIPDGVEYLGKKSGNGTIYEEIINGSQNYEAHYWIGNFNNNKYVSITFTVKMVSLGTKTFTFREETTGKLTTVKVTSELPPVILFWGDFNSIINTGESLEMILTCYAQVETEKTFTVTFPEDVTVNWDNSDFTVTQDNNVHTVTKTLNLKENYFKFNVSFPDIGKYNIIATGEDNTINRTIKVRPSNLSLPYFTKIVADDYVRDRLGNSKEYTLSSMMKIIVDSSNADLVESYGGNYCLGVFNTTLPEDATDEYIFNNAEFSNPISTPNTWEDIKLNFFYSEDYPLIFLICGEYIESIAEDVNIQYTYPCLIEEDYRKLAEFPGVYEYPIKNITGVDGASIHLQPGEVTEITKLYDIDLTNFLESDEDNRIIQGVSILMDVASCNNPINILCKLVSPSFHKEGTRSLNMESIFIEEDNFNGIIQMGGTFDLWGLDFEDFKLSKLEDLEINLQLLNNFEEETYIEFNNLRIIFYYIDLEESKIISKVNDIDLRYYSVFIKEVNINPGANNDVKYLEVEGTDSNLAYRSNIKAKEIEMEIRVPGCTIEETTAFVERLGKLLTNKRDKFNKPVLNTIEFSHYPNRVWEYILEDSLDLSAEYTEYEGKIKLIVPSGTSYSKLPVTTNATGVNSGIAKVNPILRLIAQGPNIIVKETVSNQEWRLNDSTLEVGDIVRVDCSERKAYKVEGKDDDYYEEDSDDFPDADITANVDFNSDWFLLHGEYNFECENTAMIQSVTFHERW